jgi:RNA polymerase sigma-70 factor (ECF subfamily)
MAGARSAGVLDHRAPEAPATPPRPRTTAPPADPSGSVGDGELIAAIAAGDNSALRLLYQRHAPWLSVRLRRRCADPEVVADALQDTFVAAWRSAGQWRGDGEVGAWLWGIAARRLVSAVRRRRVTLQLTEEDLSAALGCVPSVEDQLLVNGEYGALADALERLSPQMRAVVQATVVEGLTTREAAGLLGIPENTVKTRLHRARIRLREELMAGWA